MTSTSQWLQLAADALDAVYARMALLALWNGLLTVAVIVLWFRRSK